MWSSNLRQQNEAEVKKELELLITRLRESNYSVSQDMPETFLDALHSLFNDIEGKNKPLLTEIRKAFNKQNVKSIADFCCGDGTGTIQLADAYPDSDVFGYDIDSDLITEAKRAANNNPKVHFLQRDMYKINEDQYFDLITFHRACGILGDRIIQYAIDHKTPNVAGRFCCYSDIAAEILVSDSSVPNLVIITMEKQFKISEINIVKLASDYTNRLSTNFLSTFVQEELGFTLKELQKVSAIHKRTPLGYKIIDLNRVLKLIENDYSVSYNSDNHIILANKT